MKPIYELEESDLDSLYQEIFLKSQLTEENDIFNVAKWMDEIVTNMTIISLLVKNVIFITGYDPEQGVSFDFNDEFLNSHPEFQPREDDNYASIISQINGIFND